MVKSSTCQIALPVSWEDLSQPQLRRALQLYGLYADSPQWQHHVRVAFFLYVTRGTIVRHTSDGFLCSFPKNISPLPVLVADDKLPAVLAPLAFLDAPEKISVRLDSAAGRKAVDFELRSLPFGQYLRAENFYQAFLATENPATLSSLASVLYQSEQKGGSPTPTFAPEETLGAFLWYGAAKAILATWFPHFFRPVDPNSSKENSPSVTRESLFKSTQAQIRLLTGGDVTKQPVVLDDTDTWTALAELDAQARIAEELKAHQKS